MTMKIILLVELLTAPFWTFAQRRNTGDLRVPTPLHARRGFISVQEANPLRPVAHPQVKDLEADMPIPDDQYGQGSCAAWATCFGLVSYLQSKLQNRPLKNARGNIPDYVYSPSYLYNQLNKDPQCKIGLLLDTTMANLQTMGTVPLANFPYDPQSCGNLPTAANETGKVTLMDAYTIYNWWATQDRLIDTGQVKDVLAQNYPVVVGIHIDTTFEQYFPNEAPSPGPPYIWTTFIDSPLVRWYHAMLCVGYDNNLHAFKLMNSWSTQFGNGGFIWVSDSIFVHEVKEAYYSTLIPAGITLVTAKTKETRQGPGHRITTNESGVLTTDSWLQAGSFRIIGGYEISCLYVDAAGQSAILQIRDIANDRFTRTLLDKNTMGARQFLHDGLTIGLSLKRVSPLSKTDTRPAAFFEFSVDSRVK